MFSEAKPRETLRSRGNKTHCFPRGQSFSVLLYLPTIIIIYITIYYYILYYYIYYTIYIIYIVYIYYIYYIYYITIYYYILQYITIITPKNYLLDVGWRTDLPPFQRCTT